MCGWEHVYCKLTELLLCEILNNLLSLHVYILWSVDQHLVMPLSVIIPKPSIFWMQRRILSDNEKNINFVMLQYILVDVAPFLSVMSKYQFAVCYVNVYIVCVRRCVHWS